MTGTSASELTRREALILDMVRQRMTRKEIARVLHISVRTVGFHLSNAYHKTGRPRHDEFRDLLVRIRHRIDTDYCPSGLGGWHTLAAELRDMIDSALDGDGSRVF